MDSSCDRLLSVSQFIQVGIWGRTAQRFTLFKLNENRADSRLLTLDGAGAVFGELRSGLSSGIEVVISTLPGASHRPSRCGGR